MAKAAKTKDEIIDDLLAEVVKKKAEIAKAEKPKWETNCTYVLNGERINIQTVSSVSKLVDIGVDICVQVAARSAVAAKLGVKSEFKKDGFTEDQWMSDLSTRISKIEIANRKAELNEAEERLNKLISPEKREQMELAAIQKMLAK